MPKPIVLTDKQAAFVREYLVDLCAAEAAVRAGYSKKTAKAIGWELMQRPHIQEALKAAMDARAERTGITADKVLEGIWAIAQADVRHLVEFRRNCCRYCWGQGNRYQRTAGEMERAQAEHAAQLAKLNAAERRKAAKFNEQGGVGFHAKREPNPECGECFGDGVGETFIHDTRNLSPEAARLYAGVKQTKEGLEVKLHSVPDALARAGDHLGLWRQKVEHSGPGGTPLPAAQIAPVFNITLTEE